MYDVTWASLVLWSFWQTTASWAVEPRSVVPMTCGVPDGTTTVTLPLLSPTAFS